MERASLQRLALFRGARRLANLAGSAVLTGAVLMTWFRQDAIVSVALASLALALLAFAVVVLVEGAASALARFRTGRAVWVVLLANAAFAASWLSAPAAGGGLGAWAPAATAALILALVPYRPARELVVLGTSSAVLAGTLSGLSALASGAPPALAAVGGAAPIVITTAGGAATSVTAAAVAAGQCRLARAIAARDEDRDRYWLTRTVQQRVMDVLEREVVPFLSRVLDTKRITIEDAEQARLISDAIRRKAVAITDRAWIDSVVDRALESAGWLPPPPGAVSDPQRLLDRLPVEDREQVRAVVMALATHPWFGSAGFRLAVTPQGSGVLLDVESAVCGNAGRRRLRLAVSEGSRRETFHDLAVTVEPPE